MRSIATSIALSSNSCTNSLPPLEPHHDSNLPRPTTPDVIAMVSSIQEECTPVHLSASSSHLPPPPSHPPPPPSHPPPPPLHNPAANPPPLYSHAPQMPQISAAREPPTTSPGTPPTMKRWNKGDPEEAGTPPTMKRWNKGDPEEAGELSGTPGGSGTQIGTTYKNLPRLTAKSLIGEDAEESQPGW